MSVKQTFWWYGTGGDANQNGRHLFVVLAVKADGQKTEYLVVAASTFRDRSDETCLLDASCCMDLDRLSYAAYYKMRFVIQSVLDAADMGNKIKLAKPFTADAFARICDGIMKSPESQLKYQRFYQTHKD